MGLLLLIAIAVVYIVLGVLYESFIHPITILSGLPAAGFGALADPGPVQSRANDLCVRRSDHADRYREEERDHANRLRAGCAASRGSTPEQAIVEGCLVRFRPIMMTTMAAMFGSLPIALGLGAGGEALASAWSGRCGRPDLFTNSDSVSDSGCLHISGSSGRESVAEASPVAVPGRVITEANA